MQILGTESIVAAETKMNKIVYTWPTICTVQLNNTWRQAGISRGFVDYSRNGGHTHTQSTDTQGWLQSPSRTKNKDLGTRKSFRSLISFGGARSLPDNLLKT